jgi:hypothetical protein
MEVGTVFAAGAAPPTGVDGWKVRRFVRLIVRLVGPAAAVGTVITTGDHPVVTAARAAVAGVVTTWGFSAAQVALEGIGATIPQL